MDVPIIKLELDRMKLSIQAALTQHTQQINADLEKAVAAFCTSENLQKIIEQQVNTSIEDSVSKEIESFFAYGDGRKVIRDVVKEKLIKQFNINPLE